MTDTEATAPTTTSLRGRLSQETFAIVATIVTVGVALAALILTTTGNIRTEAQADRAAAQAAAEANRAAFEAAIQAMHERSDAERRRFEAQILRLTREQARLAATVDSRPP